MVVIRDAFVAALSDEGETCVAIAEETAAR